MLGSCRLLALVAALCLPSPAVSAAAVLPGPGRGVQVVWDGGAREDADGLNELYVAYQGGLARVLPHMQGEPTVELLWSSPLVDITAIAQGGVLFHGRRAPVVLDRASKSVLVLDPAHGYSVGLRFPAGSDPRGVEADQYGISVTDAGENVLRTFVAGAHGRWKTLKPLHLGAGPGAVVLGGQPETFTTDLYIANAGSGTVTALRDSGRRDIPIGGHPIAVLARPSLTGVLDETDFLDLDNDVSGAPDLVVLDAAGSVSTWLGHGKTFKIGSRVTLPGGPASGAVDAAFLTLRYAANPELAIAAPGAHAIFGIPVHADGTLGAPSVLAAGVDAVALAGGSFGGDEADDLAYVNADGTLGTLVIPGDRLVAAGAGLRNLNARDGRVVWSHRLVSRRYQLGGATTDGTPLTLPTAMSRRPFRPHLGRARDGTPVLAYVRCRTLRRCRGYVWSFANAREREVRPRMAAGCQPTELAEWGATRAYIVGAAHAKRHCPNRGIWLAHGRTARRRGTNAYSIADLRGSTVFWEGDDELRVGHTTGRAPALDGSEDFTVAGAVALDDGFAYWWEGGESSGATLLRTPLSPLSALGRSCRAWQAWPPDDKQFPNPINDFTDVSEPVVGVDHGRVFYAIDQGIFELARTRLRWAKDC